VKDDAGAGFSRAQGHGDLAPRMEADAGYVNRLFQGVLMNHDQKMPPWKTGKWLIAHFLICK
jgi:hypothetical protein